MTFQEIIEIKKEEFDAIHVRLHSEYGKIRSGRASTSLVDELVMDYYGTPTPLKQAANITVPEARQIVIMPWDKSILALIEETIKQSDLGLNASNDGSAVRINLPPMTEDNRKELVKVLNNKTEEARVSVRSVREEIWKEIQKVEKDGGMSEDDKFAGKDALQIIVDDQNKKIEDARKLKEEEILTV